MPNIILPVADLRALRITCRSCGSAVVIPFSAKNGPTQCFNCARPLPGHEAMKLIREMRWLQDFTALKNSEAEFAFDAAIEHVEPTR